MGPMTTSGTPAAAVAEGAPIAVGGPAGDADRRAPGAIGRLLGTGLFALAVGVPLLRQRGTPALRTIWAEDGFIFHQQAREEGLGQLFRGFAHYLSLPPRLLSLPTPAVPVEHLATYYALAGTTVAALLAAFVVHHSRGWVASTPVRLALGAFIVLTPAAGQENTANVTNTIWLFAAVLPWAVVSREVRLRDVVVRAVVAALAATSTVLSVAFAPLVVGWALLRRGRDTAAVAVAYGAGTVVQAWVALRTPEDSPIEVLRGASDMAHLTAGRVFGVYLLGDGPAVDLWRDRGPGALLVVALVVVVALGLLVGRAPPRSRLVGLVLAGYAVVSFLVVAWGRGTVPFGVDDRMDLVAHMRYSVPPSVLLASAFAVLVAPVAATRRTAARGVPQREVRPVRAAYLLHLGVVVVLGFSVSNYRSMGPSWPEEVDRARSWCAARSADAEARLAQDRLPFWTVRIPCRELR